MPLTTLLRGFWFAYELFLVKQVLIRLIGADEHMYASYMESMQWIEETNVLEMIADKFSSSVSSFECLSIPKFVPFFYFSKMSFYFSSTLLMHRVDVGFLNFFAGFSFSLLFFLHFFKDSMLLILSKDLTLSIHSRVPPLPKWGANRWKRCECRVMTVIVFHPCLSSSTLGCFSNY